MNKTLEYNVSINSLRKHNIDIDLSNLKPNTELNEKFKGTTIFSNKEKGEFTPVFKNPLNAKNIVRMCLYFDISKNLNRSLEDLKKIGYWTYALDMKGKLINKNFKFDKKTIIILGNEANGIRKNILNNSDFIISLPQDEIKGIDSYNAANSLAMALLHHKVNIS